MALLTLQGWQCACQLWMGNGGSVTAVFPTAGVTSKDWDAPIAATDASYCCCSCWLRWHVVASFAGLW